MARREKVLLVGWDAADWKVINPLMDAGKMPNVQRLVDNGSMGQIATLHPPLSPMLWTSIATGKRPFKHGIHGFSEPTADGLGIQPVTNLSRKCKAVWNILNQNGLRSVVIGWWPSHPAEPINGVMVSDHYHRAHGPLDKGWPLLPRSVHPPELHDTLAELRFHPNELAPSMIEPFVPKAEEIDQDKDKRLAGCMRTLCECVSIHSAATYLIEHEPWDFFAVYYDAIDHFCHGFMKYHPPRQEFIPEADFELYHNVVSMAYQFHDQMLGTLLNKAGEDMNVILMSDHGFHPDHLRPKMIPSIPAGPAIEHRDFGILAMRGPGIKKDELLHGPSVIDITPTILTLYGLPVGADMDGKVLVSAFEKPLDVQTIPTWEEVPGADGRHPPHTRLDPQAARESLAQLVALGYIARPDENREKAVADTIAELRYNLSEAYQDDDQHAEALEILRELHRADPDEQRYAVHRFVSCQALGLLDEMSEIVADLDGRRRGVYEQARVGLTELSELVRKRMKERKLKQELAATEAPSDAKPEEPDQPDETGVEASGEAEKTEAALLSPEERQALGRWRNLARFDPPVVDYLKAQVRAMEGRPAEALKLLERVQEAHLARPGLFLQTADLYLKLGRWEEAEQTYAKALSVDPDNPHAHVGMSRMALRRGDYARAAQSALDALQRMYHYPVAHFLLGEALIRLREWSRAAEAFRGALSLNPNFPQAHRRLAGIARRSGDSAAAAEHLRLFEELKAAGKNEQPAEAETGQPTANESKSAEFAETEALPVAQPSAQPAADLTETIVVVTGLPRSGTSMIMQMLAAGGLPVLSDGRRTADVDNPLGYFEYEPVKHLHESADWLTDARGHAVKIVAPLLRYLPHDRDYRIVFIERNVEEVLASQAEMLTRRGEIIDDTPARRSRLKESCVRQVQSLKTTLLQRPRMRTLFLNHAEVLRDPNAVADSLNLFLGGKLNATAMAAKVKPLLHRQRAAETTAPSP
ncbi:MAG TPA: alkaline phosphatase family protein [Pirellulales bacterium]|nr:alkaline phosphatase family protein [Pirellulales bacterium]